MTIQTTVNRIVHRARYFYAKKSLTVSSLRISHPHPDPTPYPLTLHHLILPNIISPPPHITLPQPPISHYLTPHSPLINHLTF